MTLFNCNLCCVFFDFTFTIRCSPFLLAVVSSYEVCTLKIEFVHIVQLRRRLNLCIFWCVDMLLFFEQVEMIWIQ